MEPEVAAIFGQLRTRVQQAIVENVADGEPVRAIVRGSSGQAIIGTDRRAIVCKPGFMAGATFGAEVTTYSYLNITGIQVHKGMVTGTVVIETGQQATKTSYWKSGSKSVHEQPNAVPVAAEWEEVKAQATRLRHLVDEAHSPMITPQPAVTTQSGQSSMADELAKLVEFRDKGILTPEEFDAAKQRVLSS